jgi:NADH-quinone oxidoreductase subunit F
MDLHLSAAEPTADERAAIDAVLGAPRSAWDGGERGAHRDYHTAEGGRSARDQRHFLVPALHAVQWRTGWVSEGALTYICRRLSVPPAEAWGVVSFYGMFATSPRPLRVLHVCEDVVCRVRGGREVIDALTASFGPPLAHEPQAHQLHVDPQRPAWVLAPCVGMCDAAPAALMTDAGNTPRACSLGHVSAPSLRAMLAGDVHEGDDAELAAVPQSPDAALRLLRRVGTVSATSMSAYSTAGGFTAWERAQALGPDGVIAEVTASGLLGRGGAAFPTGRKWAAVRAQPATPRYVVCNADESEPGTFKDRVLLTHDPFAIVEALMIAAYATGSDRAFVYLRAEYPLAHTRLAHAISETRQRGLFAPGFDIEIRTGAGAYICGEETALFESIEGKRGEPRSKPPFPVAVGLFGQPTLVNNVETLANIPDIVLRGGAAFAATGTPQSTGTRLFCLSGNVQRPGVYEVPMGTTLGELLTLASGVPTGRTLKAILLGGAAGGFVRADELDLRLTHEDTRAAGTTLGSGVVVVFDDTADVRDAVLRIAAFFRHESCGQCVPCRVGTVRQEEALHRLVRGTPHGGAATELGFIRDVGVAMRDASICGLGQTAYTAVESAIERLKLFEERV